MPKSKRKFYKMVVKLTVLSERPFTGNERLKDLAESIDDGDDVGTYEAIENKEIDATEAVKALRSVGSEPGFFSLTEAGQDI